MNGYAGEVGHIVIDPAGARCACGKRGCWEAVLRAAQPADRIAVLATGIAGLINIFNPPLVVLGGPLGRAMKPAALDTLREQVAAQVTMPADSLPEIEISPITSNACAMGGVALVLDDILHECNSRQLIFTTESTESRQRAQKTEILGALCSRKVPRTWHALPHSGASLDST